ncbi:hypothetical protein LINGRAHAP2_LOCUS12283, partial [Linum grandiflorum]
IDCVNIYKQPAFSHPLLKNHTLQLKPSSYPTGSKSRVSPNSTEHIQMWHRNGEYCPKGTVAILRSSTTDIPPKNAYDLRASNNANLNSVQVHHSELATVSFTGSYLYGINADMSVWNPKIKPNESSSSQIWLTNGGGPELEAIEAGWMVTSSKPHPALFVYWTADGYGASGCYNLECSGFVQTSSKLAIGAFINPVSIYDGEQSAVSFKIYKDFKTGHWWLNVLGADVGYWPVGLFAKLKTSAQLLMWGGKVVNTNPLGIHTSTQMGSGHFPSEGYRKAAWFKNLEYIDESGVFRYAADISSEATRPGCYDVQVPKWDKELGASFLYGGPGLSIKCLI